MQLLTPEQIDEIKRIITRHHAAIILRTIGPEALTPTEEALLQAANITQTDLDNIEDAYTYGKVLSKLGDDALGMPINEIDALQYPLSRSEQLAVQHAELHAGTHIRHLGAKVEQQFGMLVFREDAKMRAELLRDEVVPAVKQNLLRRETINQLASDLRKRVGDWERDWERVAITEKTNAMNVGQANTYAQDYDDPWVFKRPMPSACPHCLKHYLGPDGAPRIFRLSALQANGTNVGRKAADWLPVVGALHPRCECILHRVPDGWGFDQEGELVPGGKLGIRYADAESMSKAEVCEEQFRKSIGVGVVIDYGGVPIRIEHPPGSVREWVRPDGSLGQTRVIFAYGEVLGTRGPDGDPLDVYVGPESDAPFVYMVHQINPDTGEADEQKAMLGFANIHTAQQAYLAHYDTDDWFGGMSVMPFTEWRDKLSATCQQASMQADGFVKATPRLVIGSGRPIDALRKASSMAAEVSGAQTSPMGNRAVGASATGANYVFGFGSPFESLQSTKPRVQITPEELIGEKPDRRFGVYVDPEIYKRWDRPELVHPMEAPVIRTFELGARDTKRNRKYLEKRKRQRDNQWVVDASDE